MNRQEKIDSIKKRIKFYRTQRKHNSILLQEKGSVVVQSIFRERMYQAEGALEVLVDILKVEFDNSYEGE